MLKKIAIGAGLLFAMTLAFIIYAIATVDLDEVEPAPVAAEKVEKNSAAAAMEEEAEKVEKEAEKEQTNSAEKEEKAEQKPSAEPRIKAALSNDDEFEFTESSGALFVQARAVSANRENVAKEKLYRTVKALQGVEEIESLTINVQGPGGSPLLIKYRISGEGLRAIDFEVIGYDNVLYAADQLSGKFAK